VDLGGNPRPHEPEILPRPKEPSLGSTRPSRAFWIGAGIVGAVFVTWFGYQVLWGSSRAPVSLCQGITTLHNAIDAAQNGSLSGGELATELIDARNELAVAGTLDASHVGTWASVELPLLEVALDRAIEDARRGGTASRQLAQVQARLIDAPRC
jgi:hypothetical protein